jgi:phage gpG-like protein
MDFMGVPIFFSLVKHISQTLMEEVMSTFTLSRNGKYATQKWGRRVYGGTILKESGKLYTGWAAFFSLFSLHKQTMHNMM